MKNQIPTFREAFNKIQDCKISCENQYQLRSIRRMVDTFKKKYEGQTHEGRSVEEYVEELLSGVPISFDIPELQS